jgi:O-antigen/teichoic acid export membrane protein
VQQKQIIDCETATAANAEQIKTGTRRKPALWVNVLSNWAPLMATAILAFVVTPFLIKHLGRDTFGVWMLCLSVVGYYGLLELGVGSGVVRYVSYYNGLGDRKNVNEVMSTAMVLYLFVGLIIFLVSLFAARPIANFFKSDEQLVWLIRILGFASVIACPTNVLDACVRAHERWIPANMFSFCRFNAKRVAWVWSHWYGSCGSLRECNITGDSKLRF